MKTKRSMKYALAGLVSLLILASSCELPADKDSGSSSDTSDSGLLVEFTGCDFSGATAARVAVIQGSTPVAYGSGTLTGGDASFRLKDVNTDEPWTATLNVHYSAIGYCYAGSARDPVPTNGYWQGIVSDYIEFQTSEYAKMSFEKSYFTLIQ